MVQIVRHTEQTQITLDTTLADTPVLMVGDQSGLGIIVATAIGSTTFFVSHAFTGDFKQLKDKNGVAVTIPGAANTAYQLPDECFPFAFIKLIPTNDDVAVRITQKS